MRQYPLEKNMPSLNYIINNWPRSKPILKKFILSRHSSPNLLKICQLCLKELKVFRETKINTILRKASKICLINKTNNTYHNSHHFKAVVVIACIIAKNTELSNRDKVLLVIISLCHDIEHQGRRIISKPYYQEEISYHLFRRLSHKFFFKKKELQRISKIFKNTYFAEKPKKVSDNLEKIILDADILSSLMFDVTTGLNFAGRLKHELKMTSTSEELFKSFLNSINNKSLYMDRSKKLC